MASTLRIMLIAALALQWSCRTLPTSAPDQPPPPVEEPGPPPPEILIPEDVPAPPTPAPPLPPPAPEPVPEPEPPLQTGAERLEAYLPRLEGKKVALVVNHTSMVGPAHLVDTLLSLGIQAVKIFAPEHGFRGEADAGEQVKDEKDVRTGLPLVSLYGNKKKPSAQDLQGIDWLLFDIQDVGARFYTYISTLHYVMEASAEHGIPLLILDRPNPNGHYVDGPVLKPSHSSFVGMHPVPVVHGMTVGEYARMVNSEGWLTGGQACALTVIPCAGYTHHTPYELPVPPSPNLPNMRAIYLYPSTCFFEGTVASEGRGTTLQFQAYGHPDYPKGDFTFTPEPMPGARQPKLQGQLCRGYSLAGLAPDSIRAESSIQLGYLIRFYQGFPDQKSFFLKNLFFDKLAGGTQLREQIIAGKSEDEIRQSWQPGLATFKELRRKYLLYEDFE